MCDIAASSQPYDLRTPHTEKKIAATVQNNHVRPTGGLVDSPCILPIEVCSSASPSAYGELRCLIRSYLSENANLFFSFGVSTNSTIENDPKISFQYSSIDRMSLRIPLLTSASKPLHKYITSLRLGDYGPLEQLENFIDFSEQKDSFISEEAQLRLEDELFFLSCPGMLENHIISGALDSPLLKRMTDGAADSRSPQSSGPQNDSDLLSRSWPKVMCPLQFEMSFFKLYSGNHVSDESDKDRGETCFSSTEVPCAQLSVKLLPHSEYEGLWEALVYHESLKASRRFKQKLLSFVKTSLLFSAAQIDPNLIRWNRLILFHGPPGTGKTSLCRALSHKMSIVMRRSFPKAVLVEIHSQQIFSRWFSESGKHVVEAFSQIRSLAEDSRCLVCVLMDEVESLVAARQSVQGNEPADALRVVNTILTQLDSLQLLPNILLLCTSNLVEMIDEAFLDRVDKKVFVGPPGSSARRLLFRSSFAALMEKRLISWPALSFPKNRIHACDSSPFNPLSTACSLMDEIIACSTGMSGRWLRKVPFLAFMNAVEQCCSSGCFANASVGKRSLEDAGDAHDGSNKSCRACAIHFLRSSLLCIREEAKKHHSNLGEIVGKRQRDKE